MEVGYETSDAERAAAEAKKHGTTPEQEASLVTPCPAAAVAMQTARSSKVSEPAPDIFHPEDEEDEPQEEDFAGMTLVTRALAEDIPQGISGLEKNQVIVYRKG